MVGSKISLLFLAAAVLLVSAQEQPEHHGKSVTTRQTRTFDLLFGRPPVPFPVYIPGPLPGAGIGAGIGNLIQGILYPGSGGVIVGPGPGVGPGPTGPVVIASYHSHNYRPKPQTSRPYGYGYGHNNHGYNHGYGHYPYRPKPQQQPSYQYPNPCVPQSTYPYADPTLPQISPPVPWDQQYLDPTLPQISPPGPIPWDQQYLDPTLPQISEPYFPDPDFNSPYEPENFIYRTLLDMDDIRARGERTISNARDQIRRNEISVRDFVDDDVKEPGKMFHFHEYGIETAAKTAKEVQPLSDCIKKANTTIQQRAIDNAARSKRCIERETNKAEAAIDQTQENLTIDAKSRTDRFNAEADKLRQCSSENNQICSKNRVEFINRNVANFAAGIDFQVKKAQTAAIQHMIDLAVCRTMQDQSHRETRALARELVDDCIGKNTNKLSVTSD